MTTNSPPKTDAPYTGRCHICDRELSHHSPPDPSLPGIGTCPEHGVSYDQTYQPGGSA